ncbi:probable N-acetyltransferase 16 isoform X2 [Branchiostoma lanceolatum]|uniref:probable N-acetyltransferase 16 isoform X2 n=1 Tax=Branchiostoma lanceolatum TaxID=7740 RepID=UPI0034532711
MANKDSFNMTCRQATHSDYDAVMKIASVDTFRDGFDYLPAKFHQWVDDPEAHVLVAETDDKMLAVNVCFVTDGGAHLFSKTFRIAPELQRKKLGMGIRLELEKALKLRLHPWQRQLEQFTLADVKRPYLMKDVSNKKDICFIDVMYFQGMTDKVLESNGVHPPPSQPSVMPYQPSDMSRLARPEFSQQILSDNNIFVDWDLYKLSASNLRGFSKRGVVILVDNNESAAKSLSFGGSYMTPRGRLYHVDVHCRDVALCQAHIKHHVDRACREYEGMITFCVMVIDPSLKITSKTFCVEKLGLVHLPYDHRYLCSKFMVPVLIDPSKSRL